MLSGNNAIQTALREGPRLCSYSMKSLDDWLVAADNALRTVAARSHAGRPNPSAAVPDDAALAETDKALAGALMRVNHVGEVCAQALYQAQALTARSDELRREMDRAAREEGDHLAWTEQRLEELGARPSLLNPLWYAGAFGIGLLAGRLGDRVSLGFVVETERQVEQHLAGHLDRLPGADRRSRAIVEQMKEDERRHGDAAEAAGGIGLPLPVRGAMRLAARLMTRTAHYV